MCTTREHKRVATTDFTICILIADEHDLDGCFADRVCDAALVGRYSVDACAESARNAVFMSPGDCAAVAFGVVGCACLAPFTMGSSLLGSVLTLACLAVPAYFDRMNARQCAWVRGVLTDDVELALKSFE